MSKLLIITRWLLLALIVASAVYSVVTAVRLWHLNQVNAYINNPEAADEVPDDARARLAHAGLLERQEEHDLALEELTQVLGEANAQLLPSVYYNRGNINLREALKMTGSDGRQIPLVELAKQDYRSALALEPQMWNARYNLEVALRIVPEDPANNEDFEKNVISSQRSIESKAFKVDLP
jgi:mxaK protein